MSILTNLTIEAKQQLSDNNVERDLRIDNIIIGKTLYTIKDSENVFSDMNFCLVLFEDAYGFSYFQDDIDYSLSKFVNKNAFQVLKEETPIFLKVAILDALFCLINKKSLKNVLTFKGTLREKAIQRAKELLKPVPKGANVLLLGAVTEIIEEAQNKECNLKVLDLEQQKIGLQIYSKYIENSKKTDMEKEIQNTDYIIATGMVFVSETADNIFEFSKKYGKHLILFMETGSNFGPQLLKYGATTILSEFFPFYDFYGDTKYSVVSVKK